MFLSATHTQWPHIEVRYIIVPLKRQYIYINMCICLFDILSFAAILRKCYNIYIFIVAKFTPQPQFEPTNMKKRLKIWTAPDSFMYRPLTADPQRET